MNKFLSYVLIAALIPAGAFAQGADESQRAQADAASSGEAPKPETQAVPAPAPRAVPRPQMEIIEDDGLRSEYAANARPDDGRDGGFSIKGLQIGAGAGILGGANFQIGYRIPYSSDNFWKNRLGFRIEYNTAKPFESMVEKQEIKIDDEKFTPHIEGKQFGALVDFYPFSYTWFLGGWRISGGYYMGDFALGATMHKEASGIFSMKDQNDVDQYYKVDAAADLAADLAYDSIRGPYVGTGFDLGLFWGLKLYFDAGLVFTEKPGVVASLDAAPGSQVTFCGTDDTCATAIGTYSISGAQVDKLLEDTVKRYENELEAIRKGYFPIVKLGLMFRF